MLRGRTFYLRRPINGKDTWRSLRTSDLPTAQRRAKILGMKLLTEPQPQPSDTAARWLQDALAADAEYRKHQPARTIDEVEEEVEMLDYLLGDLRERLATEKMTPLVTTVRKNMAGLAAVLSWAMKQGHCETNVATGLLPVKGKRAEEDRRLPYTCDQLRRIFSRLPCPQNGYPASPPSRWWLPVLSLYTGARLEELGQLHLTDVRVEEGTPYLDLAPGAGKKLKTKGSRRRVPLHPEILRLGFLAYVASLLRDGQGAERQRVFPELKPDPHRALTGAYSKWYGRFLRKTAGITDRRFTFHSFRHTFKDACRAAGLSDEIHDALTGHSNGGSVGRRYGRGVPLRVLAEAVSKIMYPELNLSHLETGGGMHEPA